MKKEKTLSINGKDIVIREMTGRQIMSLIDGYTNLDTEITGQPWYIAILKQVPKIAGIPYEEWLDFTPSEMSEVWKALKEVNASFLAIPDLLESWGLGAVVQKFKNIIQMQIEQLGNIVSGVIDTSKLQSQEPKSQESNSSTTPTNPEPTSQPAMTSSQI